MPDVTRDAKMVTEDDLPPVVHKMFPRIATLYNTTLNIQAWGVSTYIFTSVTHEAHVMIIPKEFLEADLDPWRAEICLGAWQALYDKVAIVEIERIVILIPEETSKEWKDLNDTSVLKRQTTGYWDSDWWVLQGKSDLLDAIKKEPISRLVDKIFTIAPNNFVATTDKGEVKETELVDIGLYKPRGQPFLGIVYEFNLPPPEDC